MFLFILLIYHFVNKSSKFTQDFVFVQVDHLDLAKGQTLVKVQNYAVKPGHCVENYKTMSSVCLLKSEYLKHDLALTRKEDIVKKKAQRRAATDRSGHKTIKRDSVPGT